MKPLHGLGKRTRRPRAGIFSFDAWGRQGKKQRPDMAAGPFLRDRASLPELQGRLFVPSMEISAPIFDPQDKEPAMANTMSMPKKGQSEDMLPPSTRKETLERFRLQVDRLTKSSFKTKDEAEKAGAAIKKNFSKVQVSVY